MSEPIKQGDTITLHVTGKFENGEIFDSCEGKPPVKCTVGAAQLLKGLETAVVGMCSGERKTVSVPPELGYGVRNDDLVIELLREYIPPEITIKEGMQVQLIDGNGAPLQARVIQLSHDTVTMDANHYLAGRTLIFDLEIVETGLEPDVSSSCGDCTGCSRCL
jgi:peptidylprolyl isomerase